jgi:hypothetical protein
VQIGVEVLDAFTRVIPAVLIPAPAIEIVNRDPASAPVAGDTIIG